MAETINEQGKPVLIELFYICYGEYGVYEHDSIEEAEAEATNMVDWGTASPIGIFVGGKLVREDLYVEPGKLPTEEEIKELQPLYDRYKQETK